jgi:Tfp pilus assembly protein PilF
MQKKSFFKIITFVFLIVIFFSGCAKESNQKLGAEYYKMSLLELRGEGTTELNMRQALQYIDTALEQENNPQYKAHKATLLFLLGDKKESSILFDRAIKEASSAEMRLDITNNYACLLAERGEKTKALKLFESLEHDKAYMTPQVALVNQAKIYADRKNFTKAKEKLLKAVGMVGDYVDAYFYLAKVYIKLGRKDLAREALNNLLKIERGHQSALRLSKQLS